MVQAANLTAVESSDEEERVAILTLSVPAIRAAGQYDIVVEVERDGLWQSATLFGGLVVDAPLNIASISPQWGPVSGGTVVTLIGEGFEPGNTVTGGTRVRIGSLPVANTEVLSANMMRVVSPPWCYRFT